MESLKKNSETALKQLEKLNQLKGSMRLAAEDWDEKWKTLIATILSARTLDKTTIRICNELFNKYPSVKDLSKAEKSDIEKIIKSVNFYKNKSKNLYNLSKILCEKHNCKVPEKFEKLVELPGVGVKTANVFLSELGEDAIGVDTHVAYISKYLGWTNSTKPVIIEKDLKELFPKKFWKKLNPSLVKFGKKYTSRKMKNQILDEIKNLSKD